MVCLDRLVEKAAREYQLLLHADQRSLQAWNEVYEYENEVRRRILAGEQIENCFKVNGSSERVHQQTLQYAFFHFTAAAHKDKRSVFDIAIETNRKIKSLQELSGQPVLTLWGSAILQHGTIMGDVVYRETDASYSVDIFFKAKEVTTFERTKRGKELKDTPMLYVPSHYFAEAASLPLKKKVPSFRLCAGKERVHAELSARSSKKRKNSPPAIADYFTEEMLREHDFRPSHHPFSESCCQQQYPVQAQ